MLGDASHPEADLQQRVRLSMVWQLVLVVMIDSTKRGGSRKAEQRHLSGMLCSIAEPSRNGQKAALGRSHTARVLEIA